MLYRIILYLIGIAITYLGTTLAVKSTIGAGFWAALYVGLGDRIGLSVGFWFAVFQIIIVFLNASLRQLPPAWLAFIPIILESAFFDFWLEIVFKNIQFTNIILPFKIGIFLFGLFIASFGMVLYIRTGFTRSPVDDLFLAISQRFHWRIGFSQMMVAATVMTAAFFIGGPVGLGTILSVLGLGPLIEFWNLRFSSATVAKQVQPKAIS